MFQDLLKLYKNTSNKTPLEDFNTECFAGILNMYPKIKDDFIFNFLSLPKDDYKVITQLKKDLEDYQNCIIDFTIIGNNNVCFIENKVNSKEGDIQLFRYKLVLDNYYPNHEKYLFYCTKFSDPKNEDNEFKDYNFKQFKWFEIAKFLRNHKEKNPLVIDYLNFLNQHKMGQDNTFKINNLIVLENLNKTIEIAEFHINNAKEEFDRKFKPAKYDRNYNWSQLKGNNRFSHFSKDVLESDNNVYSEILYSIQFETLELNTQIYLNSEHEQYSLFNIIDIENTDFNLVKYDYGSCIYKVQKLGVFLNDEDSDKTIKEWYVNSFNELIEIIKRSDLIWNIK